MNELTFTSINVYSRLNRLLHIVFVSVSVCFDIYFIYLFSLYLQSHSNDLEM